MQRVAAIVLTYNEEKHVGECLASLGWCDEVWVVDSFSTDRTVEIAKMHIQGVLQHKFEGFSAQRQWALDNLPIESEWVLFVDADERVSPALAKEIGCEVQHSRMDGYYVPRQQYFWGRVPRHGDFARDHVLRLHRRGRGSFPEKEVHESLEIDGPVGHLRNVIVHIARESISDLMAKVDKYSTLEALRMYRTGQDLYTTASQSYSRTNMVMKAAFRYLPCKPLWRFLYDFVLCQGFRDGRLGFTLAFSQGLYVFLSYAKLWELKQGILQPPVPNTEQPASKPVLGPAEPQTE